MAKTIVAQTMSLDGFIAAPDDDVSPIFGWYMAGDTDLPIVGVPRVFQVSKASAALIRKEWDSIGAIVTGRRDFDVSDAWGGIPPLGVPIFIVTHNPPSKWSKKGSPFTFVTDGVESAVAQAKQVANGKNVSIGGSKVVQQCLLAGLVDEIAIDLAPVLLGSGIRLFDNLDSKRIELEYTGVVEGTGVTHLRFRVLK
ncbi:MAG: dihydrofolate reductase [Chloroflexi bacterium]|nr:dihydrofolate reductase [Chloroflexota bacterium]